MRSGLLNLVLNCRSCLTFQVCRDSWPFLYRQTVVIIVIFFLLLFVLLLVSLVVLLLFMLLLPLLVLLLLLQLLILTFTFSGTDVYCYIKKVYQITKCLGIRIAWNELQPSQLTCPNLDPHLSWAWNIQGNCAVKSRSLWSASFPWRHPSFAFISIEMVRVLSWRRPISDVCPFVRGRGEGSLGQGHTRRTFSLLLFFLCVDRGRACVRVLWEGGEGCICLYMNIYIYIILRVL